MREVDRVTARVRALLAASAEVAEGDESARPVQTGWLARMRSLTPVRLETGRRATLAVGMAVLVTALVTGMWLLAQRPQAAAVSANGAAVAATATPARSGVAPDQRPTAATTTRASASSASSATAPVPVVVDVAGKVHRPGLYRLPSGARIDDAVRAAGGALAGVDLSSLNLAAKVVDGQQIRVGLPGAAVSGPAVPGDANPVGGGGVAGDGGLASAGGTGAAAPGAVVDLNTATLPQLDGLPGVGPVLAQHILDWRAAHGSFATVAQLNDVSGIGQVKFAQLRSLVAV